MNQPLAQGKVAHGPLTARIWLPLLMLLLGLALLGAMECLGARQAGAQAPLTQVFSYQLTGYANLMLLGATVLYVAHLWCDSAAVGRWATSLAALGALGLLNGLLLRGTETPVLGSPAPILLTGLHDVMPLFSACTVLIYLLMERVYRTRAAGAFVMPIVAAAVLFQAWLLANDQPAASAASPVLRSCFVRAHILSNFLAYGAFALAAALGVMVLLRHRAGQGGRASGIARALFELPRAEQLMVRALSLGLLLFTFATLLGVSAANQAWGRYWAWDPKESWAVVVWLTYAGGLYLNHAKHWRGTRLAWLAILGFGVTGFGFIGVKLFAAGLHAYA
jgi:cytochrome c-type biogenesis protein CcsB